MFFSSLHSSLIIVFLTLGASVIARGQLPVSSVAAATFSEAGEGDLYQDENDVVYIGMQDGSLRRIWPDVLTALRISGDTLFYRDEEDSVHRVDLNVATGYEKIVIWAEEASALSNNSLEWSFGNSDFGFIGIPLPEDWEAYAVSFHADNTSNANNSVVIDVVDINANNSFNTLFSFTATGANDNMSYADILTTPVTIPAGTTLGFRTNVEIGVVSSARVAVWLRR